jgi:hypothetical protein
VGVGGTIAERCPNLRVGSTVPLLMPPFDRMDS